MKVLILALILCLIIPATAYSQIADLNNVSTTTQKQKPVSTQCLDFNQDAICESIVLVNGTIIKNPDLPMAVPITNHNTTTNNSTMVNPGNMSSTVTVINQTAIRDQQWANENCPADPDTGIHDFFKNVGGKPECFLSEVEETEEESEECTGETFGENNEFQYCRPGEAGYDPEVEVKETRNDNNGNDDDDNGGDFKYDERSKDWPVCNEDSTNVPCWNTDDELSGDEDRPGCQPEDDYCDRDENCQSPRVDCIDDVNKGDDGEDSNPDDEEDSNEDNMFGD